MAGKGSRQDHPMLYNDFRNNIRELEINIQNQKDRKAGGQVARRINVTDEQAGRHIH
jgi:hypothetical protein